MFFQIIMLWPEQNLSAEEMSTLETGEDIDLSWQRHMKTVGDGKESEYEKLYLIKRRNKRFVCAARAAHFILHSLSSI